MYKIDSLDNNHKANDVILAKTLQVGSYRFLMTGPRMTNTLFGPHAGSLIRYSVKGDRVWIYKLDAKQTGKFLEETYPSEKNIKINLCDHADRKKYSVCFEDVTFAKLDENTLGIIAAIPDNETYWESAPLLTRTHP